MNIIPRLEELERRDCPSTLSLKAALPLLHVSVDHSAHVAAVFRPPAVVAHISASVAPAPKHDCPPVHRQAECKPAPAECVKRETPPAKECPPPKKQECPPPPKDCKPEPKKCDPKPEPCSPKPAYSLVLSLKALWVAAGVKL